MSESNRSRMTKWRHRAATVAITTILVGGAGGAAVTGALLLSAEPIVARPAGPVPVETMTVAMQPGYSVLRQFTGQIEAAMQVSAGFELPGRVTHVLVEEGQTVAPGQPLARLDTSALTPEDAALRADRAAALADAELARLTLARNDALTARGFRSVAAQDEARLTLARAEARIAAIEAQIASVAVRLDKSVLTAPFAARIGARLVEPGQTIAAGQPVLTLLDTAPPRLRVGLPPDLAATLSPGDRLRVAVDGTQLPATVRHLRPDLDADTRSRAVVLTVDAPALPGQTARLILSQQIDEPGFWAPLSALREGVRGSWSVMALEPAPDGDRTVPVAVEVIHTDGARVFLRGMLPEGGRILGRAPDRVAPGQTVLAVEG